MADQSMEQISEGILIQLTWWDQDVIKYRFTCSNGSFSGQTELYADHDDLIKLAECLTKFPAGRSDYRDFELGTFDHNCAGGGVRLHFSCRDSVGHSAVDVQLRADHCRVLGEV